MYKGRTKFLIAIFAIFAMLAVAVVSPALGDDSSADPSASDISIVYSDKPITVHAHNTTDITVFACNTTSETRFIFISASSSADSIKVITDKDPIMIEGLKSASVKVEIEADKYAAQGDYIVTLVMEVHDSTSNYVTLTKEVNVQVKSDLSAGNQYNRFMGIWDNNLDEPLNEAWFAALVTGLIWIIIGFIVRLFAVPIVMRLIMKKDNPDYEPMKRSLVRMCFAIIVLNGIGKAIRVLGLNEEAIDTVNKVFYVIVILVAVIVIWHLYILVINMLVKKIGVRDFIPGGSKSDFESLQPLFLYIGEIILAVSTIGAVLSTLGFDMTAIITSAGIVSLGITFGAQNVLAQFFSGLVILSTRPFKKGDLITINGGSITYRVRKVNIMQTELENWDNTDITLVPNSTLTSGTIKNITRDTLKSKIHVFISVGYDNDLSFVRSAMLEVANANPRVIKDGSVSRPSTRVTEFEDSNIQLRLSVYVDDFNDSGVIGGELRQAMFNKFKEKKISIDYTNIVVRPVAATDEDP